MESIQKEVEDGYVEYVRGREGAVIIGSSLHKVSVSLPEELDGLPVIGIGKKAFLGNKQLRSIRLPRQLQELEDWAFANCDSLRNLWIPRREIKLGKGVFTKCRKLRRIWTEEHRTRAEAGPRYSETEDERRDEDTAALLAAVFPVLEAEYLFDPPEAGSRQWLQKWDARMLTILHKEDDSGYTSRILCGEEDSGTDNQELYRGEQRRKKVRLAFLRLIHRRGLPETVKEELETYLREHTKGRASEETWEVLLGEHADESEYIQLFISLGCAAEDNLDGMLADAGEGYGEMKARLLRYRDENLRQTDFFDGLAL